MTVHPFLARMLESQRGRPGLSSGTPAEARALVTSGRAGLGAAEELKSARELEIPTRGGTLRARLLVPSGEVGGLVIYTHGGGWVIGSIDDFEVLGRALAVASGCAVLLPEYRLAPEHPFPAGLEDVEDAITWSAANRVELVGGELPLIVAGDSAGANLVTVALRRLQGVPAVALQVLVYPVTGSDLTTASYTSESEGMPLTRNDMAWFFENYAPSGAWGDENISPLASNSLGVLPDTFIVTAEHDVLRSDGELYASALLNAGVNVTLARYDGMTHGFLRLHNHLDVATLAIGDIAGHIADALAKSRLTPA